MTKYIKNRKGTLQDDSYYITQSMSHTMNELFEEKQGIIPRLRLSSFYSDVYEPMSNINLLLNRHRA